MSHRGNTSPGDPLKPLVPDWPDLLAGEGAGGVSRTSHRQQQRSHRPLIAGTSILVVLLLVGGGWLAVGLLDDEPTSHPVRPAPALDSVAGPPVPATGAYIGAWNKPQRLTDDSRRIATDEFEEGIGRKLDIVHVYRVWDEPFPTESDLDYIERGYLLQLSWAGTDLGDIASGQYDAMITQRARAIRAVGKPLFMQWRWEMDRPNLAGTGTADEFVTAWKHIKTIFDTEGASNAAWVWCPTADGFSAGRAPAFYPGDEWVDWTCVDAYPGSDWLPMKELLAAFLAWAKDHPKPIMIGEYGVARDRSTEDRVEYLRAAGKAFKADEQIKAVCYFDANPAGNADRRQYLLRDDPMALDEFGRMATTPYFNPRGLPVG